MKEFTDSEIIECLRNRDSYVVGYLSDRYLPMVRIMVMNLGGTPEDARDIFQEGLMILLERIDDRNFTLTCKFRTLLYCISENLWKSVIRQRHRAAIYLNRKVDNESETDFTDRIDDTTYREIFRRAFDSIESTGKSILRLYWEENSLQEVATKLGLTYGYVKKKKSEFQSQLIRKVKDDPEYRRIMRKEKK